MNKAELIAALQAATNVPDDTPVLMSEPYRLTTHPEPIPCDVFDVLSIAVYPQEEPDDGGPFISLEIDPSGAKPYTPSPPMQQEK